MESLVSVISQNISRHHLVTLNLLHGSTQDSVPVMWLFKGDNDAPEVFLPLLRYFLHNRDMSGDWMRKSARAVGLFYDFCVATPSVPGRTRSAREAKADFIKALRSGTIPADGSPDPSGLYWIPSPTNLIKTHLSHLDRFTEYLMDFADDEEKTQARTEWLTKPAGDVIGGSTLRKFFLAAKVIKDRSFLGHLKTTSQVARKLQGAYVNFGRNNVYTPSDQTSVVSMDPDLVADLLTVGFLKDPNATSLFEREDVTAKMVFMLLAYGGLRLSEPFHLWYNDVAVIDRDGFEFCYPQLRHPSQASTFIVEEPVIREAYLKSRGLLPRHQINHGSAKAGWKGLMTDRNGQALVFFLHQDIHSIFAAYYNAYLLYRRELVSHWVSMGNSDHPWLFVAKGFDKSTAYGSRIGAPYTKSAFVKALGKALDRVEKYRGIEIPRGKHHGTTPHALRHFYAMTLRRSNTSTEIIRRALHHRSLYSQIVYTTPTDDEVSDTLNRLLARFSTSTDDEE